MSASIVRAPLLACLLLLAGCAGAPAPRPVTSPAPWMGSGVIDADGAARWHTSCFRMPFAADGRPVWGRDLLLADRVLAPLLEAHRHDIALWRFHRRAANDAAGHQFSLLLYTGDAAYAAIVAAIDADPLLARLRQEAQLTSVQHDCRAAQSRPELGATSDPAWDPAIQRTWPYFIMGVSASWLALVHDLAVSPPANAPAADTDPIGFYTAIDARIAELWAGQGQHAYLHHLSGLYGYKPLRVQTWMQF
ncbi:MAG: hypothetical protein AB7I32_00540 [Gammaproteobacteria bacterium]